MYFESPPRCFRRLGTRPASATDAGLARSLELLANPEFPTDLLIEPDDVSLDGLFDALVGLHDGALAAKVMIVPRRKGTV